jgi:hypothetical protein
MVGIFLEPGSNGPVTAANGPGPTGTWGTVGARCPYSGGFRSSNQRGVRWRGGEGRTWRVGGPHGRSEETAGTYFRSTYLAVEPGSDWVTLLLRFAA